MRSVAFGPQLKVASRFAIASTAHETSDWIHAVLMSRQSLLMWGAVLLLSAAGRASAESTLTTGAGASADDLNFRVVIPRVLYMALGSGSATNPLVTNTTVNRATFNYSANPQAIGTGAAAATMTGRTVRARVYGNNGQITITVSHPANLTSGANTIAFSQFSVVSNSPTNLPAPAFGGGTVNPVLGAGGRITNRTANWTYSYANTVTPPAGTYNGQVTYTASMM